ncbi:putative bifunctional diguanylate cyclase/phosphodiesterase [Heliobacterium mobile]|uniref:putative bifunctional diguanylate cyclase/phosphodiesterase n=1 Tax=Heliobacterium mobile TaxID=28064 RepID=UPI0014790C95|nr:EAL domain-containing protein [Heliobacterium mobile]
MSVGVGQKEERALSEIERKYKSLLENSHDLVYTLSPEGVIIEVSPNLFEHTGYRSSELLHQPVERLLHPLDRPIFRSFMEKVQEVGSFTQGLDHRMSLKDGRTKWYSTKLALVEREEGPSIFLGVTKDISELKETEFHLKHLATHDYLTGVPNRYFFEGALSRAREKVKEGSEYYSLLLVDVDKFNLVNDLLDHDIGDKLLVNLARLLKGNVSTNDVVARLSGDEFAILLKGVREQEAEHLAIELCNKVKQKDLCPVLEACDLRFTISIGVVEIDGYHDVRQILSRAGAALYMAKSAGRSQVIVAYANERLFSRLEETSRLIKLIKGADREGRFQLFFMPVVRSSDGEIAHYEALLRLQDGDGKIISPATFIPVAESFGLMGDIERWVVSEAVRFLEKNPLLSIFVNLSGESLGDRDLLTFIEESVENNPVVHGRLGFEITETAAVNDLLSAEQWIQKLRNKGCRFALDDFGSGYSSFAYLGKLQVDYIKIDGSFIRAIDQDPTRCALVKGINELVHSLGKVTISEYVENEQIWNLIREMGVEYGQGYFLGTPSPVPQEMMSHSTISDLVGNRK